MIATNLAWSKDTEKFKKELTDGFAWQELPAVFLKIHGFQVEMPTLVFRDSIKDASKFFETKDLIVNGKRIEVKSRKEKFSTPDDFPYSTAIIDTVKKLDGRDEVPHAYIMISRFTGCMLWANPQNREGWKIEKKFDRTRKYWDSFYIMPKNDLLTMDSFLDFIKDKPHD